MGRRWITTGLLAAAGCVFGARGEAAFEAEHELQGVRELRIDLPSTPIEVFACDAELSAICPERIRYSGAWRSIGGTRDDARQRAQGAMLQFETLEGFAELRAVVPLDLRGTVDLEMDTIDIPDDRSIDLRTDLGDVRVVGTRASVSVDVAVGDVDIVGGDGGVGVWVDEGDVRVESGGAIDVAVDEGDIEITQTAGARELHLRTSDGNVTVELADDANIDLEVRASGDIRVQTANITAITRHRFVRRMGDGATLLRIETRHGSVTITSHD